MIDVRCFHRLADAQTHAPAMDALNLACGCPDPFSTFEFFAHCAGTAAAFPEGAEVRPWLLLAFDANRLVGYVAMKQRAHTVLGCRATRIDWLTAYLADRPHVVARPEDAARVGAALFAYLLGRRSEWSLLEFEQQDAGSALLPAAAAAGHGAVRVRRFPNMSIGVVALRWTSLAGYFAALSKKARSNVGRQMRALLAAGEVQLLTASSPLGAEALFDLYRRIEPHSWKGRADVAIGSHGRTIAHFVGLMQPSQPMRLVIQVLLLDGVPVAGLISGMFDKGMYAMHIVYDERHADLAPGSAMLLLGIRQAIAEGAEFVNLQWGCGYYKTRWLAQMHETCSLQVYRTGSPFYWRREFGDLKRRLWGDATASSPRADEARTARPPEPPDSPGEQATTAALVERARRLGCECLGAAEIAAAMPFATRPAGRAEPHQRTGQRAGPPIDSRRVDMAES